MGGEGVYGGGLVREFETVGELRRWVREVNALGREEEEEERREREERRRGGGLRVLF